MVDQTAMNDSPQTSTRSRPREMAQHTAAFVHDLVTLSELQARLVAVDVRDAVPHVTRTLTVLVASAVLALSCIPVALICGAWLLAENSSLTQGQSLLVTLIAGLVLAGGLFVWGRWRFSNLPHPLERSFEECARNMEWVKSMLTRLAHAPDRTQNGAVHDTEETPF